MRKGKWPLVGRICERIAKEKKKKRILWGNKEGKKKIKMKAYEMVALVL